MGSVLLGTFLFKKLKLKDTSKKIAHTALVILAIIFFFIPFDEIMTFSSPETAFSATVLGEELAMTEGEDTVGFFFRDKRGTFSTVFYYKENGRYRMCPSEDRTLVTSAVSNDVYIDVYRIGKTHDHYTLVRGYVPALTIRDRYGNTYETDHINTSQGSLYYSLAKIQYDYDKESYLHINEIHCPLNFREYLTKPTTD